MWSGVQGGTVGERCGALLATAGFAFGDRMRAGRLDNSHRKYADDIRLWRHPTALLYLVYVVTSTSRARGRGSFVCPAVPLPRDEPTPAPGVASHAPA